MSAPLKCPHCGSTAYRVLKQHWMLECRDCGRNYPFDEWSQPPLPTKPSKPPE